MGKIKSRPKTRVAAPLVQVSTPIRIKNMPASWRTADLVVESMAVFWSEDKGMVGYSIGRTSIPRALRRGAYRGTIKVSANEFHGDATGAYIVYSAVIARKGKQCMVLGIGCKGVGKSGCRPGTLNVSDKVRPYTYPFLPRYIKSLKSYMKDN